MVNPLDQLRVTMNLLPSNVITDVLETNDASIQDTNNPQALQTPYDEGVGVLTSNSHTPCQFTAKSWHDKCTHAIHLSYYDVCF